MRCETGEFPIKIIQGDSYRRVYKFYDTDGNIMDNSSIASVVLSVSRLNYTQTLNWNASEEGYVFILSADTTAEFPYCKGTYDVTLNFRDTQVSTQVYQSSWQIFEKDVFYNTITNNNGYMTCENSEVVIKTGITVSAGGAGGTDDHNLLYNRDLPNQHPMSAITGLEDALEGKADADDVPTKTSELENDSGFITSVPSEYVTDSELASALQDVRDDIPTKTSEIENDSDFVDQTYVGGIEQTLQGNIDGVQTDVDNIEAVISTQATPTNKLVSASEMGDAISAVEAKQLYATASQGSFATKAQLLSATTFYNADGTVATPTKNDIAYVLADESHSGKSAKYVVADITVSGIVWGFVITFSDTTFSQAQMDAINSGVTQQKVSAYDSHITDKSNPHEVTYQQLSGTNPSYTKGETDTLLGGKLSDAPSDGKQYARKDGEWSEVASDGALIINYNSPQTTDYANAISAFDAGRAVLLKKDNIALPMTGYDATHCFFGGTVSAYLPAGYVLCVYAHIGTNGTNYFWYPYNSPVEAAGLYSEDAGNYFTSTNVMGQLQEIGAKLATYPSEVWQGGSY